MIYDGAIELIGRTPILKLTKMVDKNSADVYVKLEKFNPGGSVKDRAALGMIEKAEEAGILKEGSVIVEPTSGNTGIALAMIGRVKGYKVIIVMPETMSKERRDLIKAYGAELVLTEGAKGMKGAIEKATEMVNEYGYFMPQQFENIANPEKHYATTAQEIYEDINDLDVFVAGVGTGGTVSGIGKNLKGKIDGIEIVAVEPSNSQVLSGKNPGPHKIQGIGAGFIPGNYKGEYVDKVVMVYAPLVVRIERAMSRDNSTRSEIMARISAQMDDDMKSALADYLIDNGGTKELLPQINSVINKLIKEFR